MATARTPASNIGRREFSPMWALSELSEFIQIGVRNFALGANLGSLKFGTRVKDAYRYWNACLFLRDSMGGRKLPMRNVREVLEMLPPDPALCFPALKEAWPWVDPSYLADLVHLGLLCKAVQPRTIFEIGTSTGYSSLFVAANSPLGARVWTLDLPSGDSSVATQTLTWMDRKIVVECHKNEPCFVRNGTDYDIRRLFGDSATFDFSPFWEKIDLFFIDGAHSYKYVRSDTIHALHCCHPGSVIAWHDYGRSGLSRGVTSWLDELGQIIKVYSTPGSSIAFALIDRNAVTALRTTVGENPELASWQDSRPPELSVTSLKQRACWKSAISR